MVFLHFPSNHTDEELILRQKYNKLRRKKKALEVYQAPKVEPTVLNPLKRQLDPKDAKDFAKKMILEGKIHVANKGPAARTVFRRPGGLQRKLTECRIDSSKDSFSSVNISSSLNNLAIKEMKMLEKVDKPKSSQVPEIGSLLPTSDASQLGLQYQPFTPSNTNTAGTEVSKSDSPLKYRPVAIARRHRIVPTGDDKPVKKEGHGTGRPRHGHTLHVRGRNLEEGLCKEAFGKIGTVINISMDSERACAFVTFDKIDSAEKAVVELNGSSIGDVNVQVSFARRQPAVAELINDAPASATWTALASSQSQKGTHQDKREQVVYETEESGVDFSVPAPEPMKITSSSSIVKLSTMDSPLRKPF